MLIFNGPNGSKILNLKQANRYWDALARQFTKLEDMLDMEPKSQPGVSLKDSPGRIS